MPEMRIQVLDGGFVELIDIMGDDRAIEEAARVSYKGTRDEERDPKQTRGLIRYLMRNRHTSPFEMVSFKFACRMPMFVARQWVRHRTASLNEISGRYAELPADYYVPAPERVTFQSRSNKQGSSDEQLEEPAEWIEEFDTEAISAFELYQERLEAGMAKELARINLPLSTYTEWVWKMDLHNLFHFLNLRLHPHAQHEIRVYAKAIAEFVKQAVPVSWGAFEDYVLNAIHLTYPEQVAIRQMQEPVEANFEDACKAAELSGREQRELREKLDVLEIGRVEIPF